MGAVQHRPDWELRGLSPSLFGEWRTFLARHDCVVGPLLSLNKITSKPGDLTALAKAG